jgi:hypothetical protein
MTYRDWTSKFGTVILDHGPAYAAMIAQVPPSFAKRYTEDSQRRDQIARSMGGVSRFFMP